MKLSNLTMAIFVMALFTFSSCGNNAPADGIYKDLAPKEFKKMMDEGKFTAIDIRKPIERYDNNIFDKLNKPYGFIAGTPLNIDWEDRSFNAEIAKLDKNKAYGIYCRSGNRTGKAIRVMQADGFKEVYNLDGGLKAWMKAGLATEVVPTPAAAEEK